jgi:hypothetical protein
VRGTGDTVACVAPRLRIVAFGSAAALVIAGAACGVLVAGVAGEVLTIGLTSAGFAGGLLLVFLEIGLGEDRDRARQRSQGNGRVHMRSSRWLRGRLRRS